MGLRGNGNGGPPGGKGLAYRSILPEGFTFIPISVKPISLVECFMEIGYGTGRSKQFHANFSYGAIGIRQTNSGNALSHLETLFKEKVSFNPFHAKDSKTEIE